jgi:hypothetical protein
MRYSPVAGRAADRAEGEAEAAGGDALGEVAAGQHADHGEAEQRQHEQLGRAEGRMSGRAPARTGQHDRAEQAAEQRGERRRRQRARGLALLGQREAVEHRRLARRRAGNAHQHRGEGVGGRDHRDEPISMASAEVWSMP